MENDKIDTLFKDLKGKFDIETPSEGHQNRFLEKLNSEDAVVLNTENTSRFNWKPLMAIAASVIICLSLFTIAQSQPEDMDLASVSPELSETQDFFTATIENELKRLNKERSPLTEQIIKDALLQIDLLEKDYQNLKTDLTESNKDQRVIYAMISNFQSRIDILNTVLEQIETIKELKNTNDEQKNTI